MIAGPYATRILGDFGAEVIKIQPESTAAGAEQNNSYPFGVWNRNKKSVTLDLNRPESKALFLELVARSDVVVENFSPRVMGNWGLDYTRLKRVKPDLVMASISAMGQTGPWRDFVGFAPTFHALSGLISETFGSRRPPDDIEYPYADLLTGLYGALAILAALKFRDRTGEGQHVDLSALEAMCTILGPSFAERPTKPDITVEEQSRIQLNGWIEDARLAARRFFVSVHHPVLGEVVSCRTALWNWRRKPRWKSSPRLGDTNKKIRNSQIEFL
jgi:crotonobetainyl-CoA:carnitine CoA-transferase CaiB-like acyl-CoA transferase